MSDIPHTNLGTTSDFRIGSLEIMPALRQVTTADGKAITIEPRVMQVLVVLANNKGNVVSRDELIQRCWNGVVVGDGAIHRVVSLIRRLLTEAGVETLSLETVPRVGYRLVEHGSQDNLPAVEGEPQLAVAETMPARSVANSAAAPDGDRDSGGIGRRGLVAAIAAAAATAAGAAFLLNRPEADVTDPAAETLVDRSISAMRVQGEMQAGQSVRYLEKAVEVDPTSGRAWGMLALAYSMSMINADDDQLQDLAVRCRAAAARSFELQPGDTNAKIAIANYPGPFRRWAAMEQAMTEVLRDVGEHPMPIAGLADVMIQTGRWSDALPQWDRLIRSDALIPVAHAEKARTLWSLGRLLEAEKGLYAAASTLPPHPRVLHADFDLKLFSGRSDEARQVLGAMAALEGGSPVPQEIGLQLADLAKAGGQNMPADIAALLMKAVVPGGLPTGVAARYLAAFGDTENAMRLFSCHYFGGRLPTGRVLPAPPQFGRRKTDELFFPTAQRLRAHPEFGRMTARLGLDNYWRKTGTRPQVQAQATA